MCIGMCTDMCIDIRPHAWAISRPTHDATTIPWREFRSISCSILRRSWRVLLWDMLSWSWFAVDVSFRLVRAICLSHPCARTYKSPKCIGGRKGCPCAHSPMLLCQRAISRMHEAPSAFGARTHAHTQGMLNKVKADVIKPYAVRIFLK